MMKHLYALFITILVFLIVSCSDKKDPFELNKWYPLRKGELFKPAQFGNFDGNYLKSDDIQEEYKGIYDDCIEEYGFDKINWSVDLDMGLIDLSHSIKIVLSKFGNGQEFQKIKESQNDSTGIYEYIIGYENREYVFKASPYDNMLNVSHNISELNRLFEEVSPSYEFHYDTNHGPYVEILYGRKIDFEEAIEKGFPVNSHHTDWERTSSKGLQVNYLKFEQAPSDHDISNAYLKNLLNLLNKGYDVPELNNNMLRVIDLYNDKTLHVMVNLRSVSSSEISGNLISIQGNNWSLLLSYTLVRDFGYQPIIDDENNMRRMYIEREDYLQRIEGMLL